ncbi:CUB and sushi domain-containing protein 3 [Tachysurus ichikawai]
MCKLQPWLMQKQENMVKLTGFQVPAPVTSTGSVFSLRLTSDFAVSAHGFKIYYEGSSHRLNIGVMDR